MFIIILLIRKYYVKMESLLHKVLKLLCPCDYANFANININYQNPDALVAFRGPKPYLNQILDYSRVSPEDYDYVPEKIKNRLSKVWIPTKFFRTYYTLDLTRYVENNSFKFTNTDQVCYRYCLICGCDRLDDPEFRDAWDTNKFRINIGLMCCASQKCKTVVSKHMINGFYLSVIDFPLILQQNMKQSTLVM
ncbi:putative orfan [Tupanvirus soda lake]|uniref:Orfan n=2 Tax=Tupanvirus TaxID=2094720 RepID=A0AC62ADX7_9VIRU|nr:putative orfan [Tupanvirus soda lake]QKU35865.1 putative orfan [Tupanvirus soda lake]